MPADGFTEARNAAAREVDDKALAAHVKKLKKPSVAAWSINLLVRRESAQIDSVLELAESLRAAAEALDGDALAGADLKTANAYHGPRVPRLARWHARLECGLPARSSSRSRGC